MAYVITTQKRGGYTRAVIETYDTAAEALDGLAILCSMTTASSNPAA